MLFLTIYMFGIAAIIFFRENDPWNFNSVGGSMLALLRITTLDNWGDVMFLNMFGCDAYKTMYYTSIANQANPAYGGVEYCATPRAKYGLAAFFFILFIVVTSFCMLSLFIGTISIAMSKSIIRAQNKKKFEKIKSGKIGSLDGNIYFSGAIAI